MKNAFTMIELIFVIVIIGILATIAIPKLANTSNESRKTLVSEYVAVLNRTASASMYAQAINDNNGSIKHSSKYCATLTYEGNPYLDPIPEVSINQNCVLSLTGAFSGVIPSDNNFTDGNLTRAPHWKFKW